MQMIFILISRLNGKFNDESLITRLCFAKQIQGDAPSCGVAINSLLDQKFQPKKTPGYDFRCVKISYRTCAVDNLIITVQYSKRMPTPVIEEYFPKE